MDQKKTGRLINKRRREMNLTMRELSILLNCTPQAVNAWEKGKRSPDPSSQIMIERVMGLNPVELLTGVQMHDEKLKKEISYHMSKTDEKVFTGGIVTDKDGNESYLDMSEFMVVTTDENGELSDNWIPYLEYHNAEPHVMTEREKDLKAREDAVPKEEYNPSMVYLNCGPAILIVSTEILEALGKPNFFDIVLNREAGWVGLRFGDSGAFDIPNEVYDGYGEQGEIHGRQDTCRGLMVQGGEFGRDLCRKMGIRRMADQMAIAPFYSTEHKMLVLDLIEAKRVKLRINLSDFALPTGQFEEELREIEDGW